MYPTHCLGHFLQFVTPTFDWEYCRLARGLLLRGQHGFEIDSSTARTVIIHSDTERKLAPLRAPQADSIFLTIVNTHHKKPANTVFGCR